MRLSWENFTGIFVASSGQITGKRSVKQAVNDDEATRISGCKNELSQGSLFPDLRLV